MRNLSCKDQKFNKYYLFFPWSASGGYPANEWWQCTCNSSGDNSESCNSLGIRVNSVVPENCYKSNKNRLDITRKEKKQDTCSEIDCEKYCCVFQLNSLRGQRTKTGPVHFIVNFNFLHLVKN